MFSRYPSTEAQSAEQAVLNVQARLEGNNFCADCGVPRPRFINLTIGTFICSLCTGIHRSLSKRRIKDIYAGDLTMDDARRMETVGNDVANRKFLATWDPRQVPEPDRRDEESLREFIWLKYEGSFKREKLPAPPAAPAPVARYRPESRYYDDRVPEDRPRPAYRREQDLFREAPSSQPQDRQRGYWSSRFETSAQRLPPPHQSQQPQQPQQLQQMRPRDDYYSRAPAPTPVYPDRYRAPTAPDRYQPPQPAQVTQYSRVARSTRGRYQEVGMPYEDYASFNSDERDFGVRRAPSSRSRRVEAEQDVYGYGYGDGEEARLQKRSKSSRSKSKLRRKKSEPEEVENGYYSEEEEPEEDVESSRGEKKRGSKKSKKSSKSKRRQEVEEEDYEDEDEDYEDEEEEEEEGDDDDDDEDYDISAKKSKKHSKKSGRRADRDKDSVVTVDVVDEVGSASGQPPKGEFDLMSEWMGESKETNSPQAAPPPQNNVLPASGPIPSAMQQAYATQVPMMPPPMSVYGGMMPLPGGGFMPMMPGFMGGMGMAGMPPGMPGMPGMPPGMPQQGVPPGMPPPMPPGMMGMAGPGAPGVSSSAQPVQGLVNGMQGLNLNNPIAQPGAGGTPPPPPPPPAGMPAGPPPGPPPEPPQAS